MMCAFHDSNGNCFGDMRWTDRKHGLYGIFNVSLSARPPFFVEEETISVCRSHTPSGTSVWY